MIVRPDFASTSVSHVSSPLVTRERFSEMVGLPLGVITGWCNKGLVPCVSIGKYSLINVALLGNRCIAKEFS
jgi:hypothetical protein